MAYVFIGTIVLMVALSIYKMIVRKEYPIIHYTLYDTITKERKYSFHYEKIRHKK